MNAFEHKRSDQYQHKVTRLNFAHCTSKTPRAGGVTVDFIKIPCKHFKTGWMRWVASDLPRETKGRQIEVVHVTSHHHSKETLESCPAKTDATHPTNCAFGHTRGINDIYILVHYIFLLGAFHQHSASCMHGMGCILL